MGWQATGWAFKAPIKNSGCKFVLVALAERAGNEDDEMTWHCFPSIKVICGYTAQGYRTVQRHLDWLEDNGFISRERRMQSKDRKGCFNFTLNPFSWVTGQFGHMPKTTPEGVEIGQAEPVKGTGHSIVKAREPDPFEIWWEAYPRKVAKVAARKAWRAVPAKIGLSDLMERTQMFAAYVVGKDPDHIAHPATWLNGERWLDVLQPRSQTDGRPTTGADRGADQHSARTQAMELGFRQALDRRRRWTLGGAPDRDQQDPEG